MMMMMIIIIMITMIENVHNFLIKLISLESHDETLLW